MGAFLRLLVLFRLWYTVDMVTLSIPQGLIKDGFVVLPRREYEDLLRAKQVNDIVVKRDKSFKVPKKHEKFYDDLDKELTESLREIKEGKVSDIFNTYEEGIKFLNSRKKFIPNEA
ncbi:MAG: hypothetical protein UT54_C0033G0008 [Candidatus Daviesbacteria bacterium GW2011_GWB1_39_5]|uniref:Uncharacterized protein n=1 Tax=Candidatus Nomurabacteria bacterium RIFCSPLOWO2_02_FULL_40_67 TaxID=1801787 RepID=A0A1F6Y4E2_9BACT|nr:MAG: hypothetical protein UT54_C0033G0008 [Candidatus Daviesbacteria bacterium GW2011_GWB1_39_5]KKS72893.1 MAG: hypothetical protein UV43_C0011G0006 [Parcubacteria group bacterium GW2011_GWF2_42_7]OGI62104.1 MAG: hypothetical protein A2W12_01980 [Candidatus Nomurabacteria bacterium RBG_16_40_11]OGI70319.1 MAG: hypothetical protein A2643_00845 [Candidatus Nomurabacteria bacterium RIFCSPHIGHO2_01_FULL_39_220]OGI73522.1 MAG: hypothetical protein A2W56_02445 [Candidatus Nomurabacteria bacterium 